MLTHKLLGMIDGEIECVVHLRGGGGVQPLVLKLIAKTHIQ